MASRYVNYWTLGGIIRAFIDLAIVYALLCGSAIAFICSNWLSFFRISLPCPCTGVFGYKNHDLCWHKLLIDWPIRKIMAVEKLIKSSFPFGSIEGHGNRKFANGISEFEGKACSTSFSGPMFSESIDRESGCEARGKKIMNQRKKSGIWRRKRAAKVFPDLSSNSLATVGVGVLHPFYDCSGLIRTFSESLDGDRFPGNCGDRLASAGNDENLIQVLERALEEEKAARAMLNQELEKERAAAATAADEAMAMILRLQEDKASIEMEARQYHRVIEEKWNYDDEEMEILKEIIVRREKEIHFLEKKVEEYEGINFLGIQQVESGFNLSGSSTSLGLMHKKFSIEGKEKKEKDRCSSVIDTESTVYDVHVIDDKTVLSVEDHRKEMD